MSQPMEDRVARAMAQLKATEEAVARAKEDLSRASVSKHSPDRSVRVSVGPQGEVTSLEFLDGKYKKMSPTDLSSVILQAINAARADMARRVMDVFDPVVRRAPGDRSRSHDSGLDWDEIFGSLISETETPSRPGPMNRLRDEMYEDEVPGPPGGESNRTAGE
ncbi:YbaB/EbfC family nucleoid-associated protein [Streptomyces griseoviridis]|nr:YbaB/EbfC family nucleoid-associated protein [Streptomyces niveoruber]